MVFYQQQLAYYLAVVKVITRKLQLNLHFNTSHLYLINTQHSNQLLEAEFCTFITDLVKHLATPIYIKFPTYCNYNLTPITHTTKFYTRLPNKQYKIIITITQYLRPLGQKVSRTQGLLQKATISLSGRLGIRCY